MEDLILEQNTPMDAEFTEVMPENKTLQAFIFPESKKKILDQIAVYRKEFSALTIGGVNDKPGFERVFQARQSIKKARLLIESIHKDGKAEALKVGREWDAAKNLLLAETDPIENDLKQKEEAHKAEIQAIKDAEQKIINDRAAARVAAMGAVEALGAVNPLDLSTMAEADFNAHLAVATTAYNAKKEAEAKAAERLRVLEAEETARKAEEARKMAEQAEVNRRESERLDAQRKDMEARETQIREEGERIEREKRDAEDAKRRESEAVERKDREAKIAQEAAEQARVKALEEAELKAKADAEAKIKREAQEKSESERQAALRPDREKLAAYADELFMVTWPTLSTQEAIRTLKEFQVEFGKLLSTLR